MGDGPDRAFGESWTWHRGAFSTTLTWDGDVLRARISAIGRDQDLPASQDEAAWMDAAAARVPGVMRTWDPVWDVPEASVRALREALGVETVARSFRLGKWRSDLLARLGTDWRVSAYWDIPGGRVQASVDARGFVRVEHGGRFVEELAALVGEPFGDDRFVGLLDVGRDRAVAVAAALFAWRQDEQSWVMASDCAPIGK